MKNRFNRILALIIAIASLFSVFSVFSFAETATEPEKTEEEKNLENFSPDTDLIYNRTYDDGWEGYNGLGNKPTNHSVTIDYEVGADGNYNYFMRLQHGESKGVLKLETKPIEVQDVRKGTAVISLSVMSDDLCDLGSILKVTPRNGSEKALLLIKGYDLYAFSTTVSEINNESAYLGSLQDGDWYNLDFVFKWHETVTRGDNKYYPVYAYLNDNLVAVSYIPYANNGLEKITLGWDADDAKKNGMGYCVDNLQIYQSDEITDKIDLPDDVGFGNKVQQEEPKTVPIYKNADEMTPEKVIEEALYMKRGVKSVLAKGIRKEISCAPDFYGTSGSIMVPLDVVLEYLGYNYDVHPDNDSYIVNAETGTTYITIGRPDANVNGELVVLTEKPGRIGDDTLIAIADVATLFPGMNAMYDDMGLVVIYKQISDEAPLNREEDLDTMLSIMKKFVFDIAEGNKEANYLATGEKVVEAVKDAIHPYIITDQTAFDGLNATYTAGDSVVKTYMDIVLTAAKSIYKDMAKEEGGVYAGFKDGKKPVNVYGDGVFPTDENPNAVKDSDDGYNDTTLRLNEVEYAAEKLVELAFAYQVTREAKYAELAYDIMLALGEWTHWGPGYMANCANAASSYAIAFDWLYNYIKENKGEAAISDLAYILYDKAIKHGVASSKGSFCQFPRTSGYGDKYTDRTDSFNAICSSGMIIASLALANENIVFSADEAEQANSLTAAKTDIKYLLGNNLRNLADYGLDQYAPDGSYIESVTYWALGTNALLKTIMALESAAGSDFGFKDTWALEKTFYYACYIANGNGDAWNYHEDGFGTIVNADVLTVDTQMFNYAGKIFGDDKLIAIRQNQINGGKTVSMFDILFYPTSDVTADTTLELDYYMEGLDAFISRSGWEKDDMFVGMMGGANEYYTYDGEKYGQIDSGNFIYENLGVKWIVDLGSDDIYGEGYFGSFRYNYYRNSGEGHNTFLIKDVPTGQTATGDGRMYETYVDPNGKGSYAIIDNGNAYAAYSTAAKRGMLITNDKKTVVIQDEVSFGRTTGNAIWVVNTYEDIVVDETKQVAYLTHTDDDGNQIILRATIVTTGSGVEFAVKESGATNLLTSTKNEYTSNDLPLTGLKRLYIATNTLKFDVAVAFEIVESTQSELEVGYEWTNLDDWDSYFVEEEESEETEKNDSSTANFASAVTYAEVIYDKYTHFTHDIDVFYKRLAHAFYILTENGVIDERHRGEITDDKYKPSQGGYSGWDPLDEDPESYEAFVKYKNEYYEYVELTNKTTTDINLMTRILSGQT